MGKRREDISNLHLSDFKGFVPRNNITMMDMSEEGNSDGVEFYNQDWQMKLIDRKQYQIWRILKGQKVR